MSVYVAPFVDRQPPLVSILDERVPKLWEAQADPETRQQLEAAVRIVREVLEKTYGVGTVRPHVETPEDAMVHLWDMSTFEQEVLRVLLLDTRHHVLDAVDVVRGSVNSAQVRIAEVFRPAVRINATAILLAHNHPSGDTMPSADDIALTQQVIQAGRLLDIEVLDHIIVAGTSYRSLRRDKPELW